jgi:peroxiredoxin
MAQFESQQSEIAQQGAQMAFIAAEKRKGMFKPAKYLQEHTVTFPFLLDEDRSVTKAYGLYHGFGHDAFNIAHPATLVIDKSGIVQFIYRGKGQTDRIPVAAVVEVVKKLREA